jgi:phage antirepressor YoqD-like protein
VDDKTMAVLAAARDELIRKDAVIGRLSAFIQEQAPMAEIGQAIVVEGKWFTVAEAAKEMAIDLGDGKRMGQNQLYAFLRATRMVMRKKDPASRWTYHQPYQQHVDAGRMKLEDRPTHYETDSGGHLVQRRTLISGTGIAYLKARIAKEQKEGMLDELVTD